MSFITLSDHSRQQAINRYCLDAGSLVRISERAVTEGFSINDAPNVKLRKYLKRKAKGNLIYAYTGKIFIFTRNFLLITTYRIPKYYLR